MLQRRRHVGFTLIELVVVLAIIGVLGALLLAAVQKARQAAYRAACSNNLRQIGLAVHGYHAVRGALPPGVSYQDGKDRMPHLSWLARLLPHLEQAPLWQQIEQAYRLDRVPFDNPPHAALAQVLPAFACPADGRIFSAQQSHGYTVAFTSYLGIEGQNLSSRDGLLYQDSSLRFGDVTDGTSQTLLAGERPPSADFWYGWWYAGLGQDGSGSADMVLGVREYRAIHMTGCPPGPYAFQDGRLDNRCDIFHFWSLHPGGAHFLMADGSVHFFGYAADGLLPALASRAGEEPVSLP